MKKLLLAAFFISTVQIITAQKTVSLFNGKDFIC